MIDPLPDTPDPDLEAWIADIEGPDRLSRYLLDGVNGLNTGLAIFDSQDRCIALNAAFVRMLPGGAAMLRGGARFPDMARYNALTYFGVAPDDVADWLARRIAYRNAPEGAAFDQRLVDGRWFRIAESRTFDGGTVTNWTDITDLKSQQDAAADYAAALRRSNAALKEFAHAASHDLKEPLRKIEVYGDRLLSRHGDGLSEKGLHYLTRMTDAATRMRQLVGDLLDYSSIGHERSAAQTVPLSEIMVGVLDTLDIALREKGGTVDLPDDLPVLHGNAPQLARLFQNVLSNAIKYARDDVPPRIALHVEAVDEGDVTIVVEDNGIGMDPAETDRIFEVFSRLHGRGKYEGTGIGLASCRCIAEQHGGSIHATSAPGQGSRFHVTLPLDAPKGRACAPRPAA